MNESWDLTIRERAREYSEQYKMAGELDNWLRAKDDAWGETLARAKPLADHLNRMRGVLDEGTNEGLRAAAILGCEAIRFLDEQTDINRWVIAYEASTPWSGEASAYVIDPELFADFLSVERQILIRAGLIPELASELCSYIRAQRMELANGIVRLDLAMSFRIAVDRACRLRIDVSMNSPPPAHWAAKGATAWYRRSARGVWLAVGGGLVVTANALARGAIGDVLYSI